MNATLCNSIFAESPKPFIGERNHKMEVLVGGLDNQIYEVEKGHHLNWVRKHLTINDPTIAKDLEKKAITEEKNLPVNFYELFPTFVRILIIEKNISTAQYPDELYSPKSLAYFETKMKTPELRRTILRVLKMFKGVETVQIYIHDSKKLVSYSRREYIQSR